MDQINHFAISAILNSEIVGRFKAGHGQIGSLRDPQRYFDLLGAVQSPAVVHAAEVLDERLVKKAFLDVRKARGDQGSPDLYVADPERNGAFLARCRELDVTASTYRLNKALLYLRKQGLLKGLHSVRTSIDYGDFAFASEFAATELKYRTGASIDDILCDSALSSEFESIARKVMPGFTAFQYRWALLSIRKAGRKAEWRPEYTEPAFSRQVNLVNDSQAKLADDPLESVPNDSGIYLLCERDRPLYARSTKNLRHGVELHRRPEALSAMTDGFWKPNLDDLIVRFAILPKRQPLRPAELRVIEEKKPIFNVSRSAA